jgi:TolB protein
LRKMLGIFAASLSLAGAAALFSSPQQPPPPPQGAKGSEELWLELNKGAARKLPIALPKTVSPSGPAVEGQIRDPFYDTLKSDLDYEGAFAIVDATLYPKGYRDATTPESADRWAATGAEVLVDTLLEISGDRVSAEARVYDLKSHKLVFGKRYTGGPTFVPRIAHAVADDIVKYFTGKSGVFMTSIAYSSDREVGRGFRELYLMDFDGRNARRLTSFRALAINPTWEPDGQRIAFTSYAKTFPRINFIGRDGSGRREIASGVELNASPSFSPDGKRLVLAGSASGNPDIYMINAGGGGLKRLTLSSAVESTPRWSPVGNQILYTSSVSGTPQLYLMDPEGANARRITFAGDWNDEGAWSPDGSKIAFACRNGGDFQICVMNLATGQTVQITAEGSNGHPSWAPDGNKIAFDSRRGGSTQIYTMDINGQHQIALTEKGNNSQPAWSPN